MTLWGRIDSETDPNGIVAEYDYTDTGWRYKRSVAGLEWITEYDAAGVRYSETTPMGFTTRFETNGLGRVIGVVDPLEHESGYFRDAMQRRTAGYDALDRVILSDYNGFDKISSITKPDIGTAEYEYGKLGNLESIQDLNGETWTTGHTDYGRLMYNEDPLGNEWHHTVNSRGWPEHNDLSRWIHHDANV